LRRRCQQPPTTPRESAKTVVSHPGTYRDDFFFPIGVASPPLRFRLDGDEAALPIVAAAAPRAAQVVERGQSVKLDFDWATRAKQA
jgi:hypothetical protein